MATQKVTCADCGADLPADHAGACPKCGGKRQHHELQVHDTVHLQVTDQVTLIQTIIKYAREHPARSFAAVSVGVLLDIATNPLPGLPGLVLSIYLIGLVGIVFHFNRPEAPLRRLWDWVARERRVKR